MKHQAVVKFLVDQFDEIIPVQGVESYNLTMMIPESVVIFTLMLLSFTELRLAAVRLTSTGLVFG